MEQVIIVTGVWILLERRKQFRLRIGKQERERQRDTNKEIVSKAPLKGKRAEVKRKMS